MAPFILNGKTCDTKAAGLVNPEELNWDDIQQGAPSSKHLQLCSENESEDPVDLTGYEANWEIWDTRRRKKFAEVTVDFPNRINGEIRGRLTAADTLLLPIKLGKAVHDLHLFPPVGDSYYLIYGAAVAAVRVSRDEP